MRRTALTIAALCATATVAASAHAGVKWQDMTTAQKTVVVKKAVRHDRTVLRWWGNHRGPPAAFRVWSLNKWKWFTPAWPACPAIDRQVPAKVCAAATRLPRAEAVLARLFATFPETGDWLTAVRIVQRAYPGSEPWLVSCSSSEGDHGPWKFRNDVGALTDARRIDPPNVPGGPMQYFQSTFWTDFNAAVQDLTARGFRVPRSAFSWFSPLGQATAAGWAYFHDRPSGKWTGSRC